MRTFVTLYRGLTALLVFAVFFGTIAAEWGPGFSLANYVSFFTVQSNVIAGLVFAASAWAIGKGHRSGRLDAWRGAVVVYLVTTVTVYQALLVDIAEVAAYSPPFLDFAFHRLVPAIVVLDWILFPPAHAVRFPQWLWWLVFPAAYLAYTLARGPLAGDWYPYPFLDPTGGAGWPGALAGATGVALFIIVLSALVAWSTRWLGHLWWASHPPSGTLDVR
ncbi:Pr6Pr family membrane protein [Salininema proteolyticum]|uniref:Pr6Pr family membrane protein n=1 Tax=Salininema proteolyticum TaxID=1607685 RepID=A0ABV8TV38_9ACTN